MKIKLIILYLFFLLLIAIRPVFSDDVYIESDNMKVLEEGNLIKAFIAKAIIPNEKIEIEGDESIYDKQKTELTLIKNVKFFDNIKNIYIEAEKLIYNKSTNIVNSVGKTYIKIEDKHEIYSDNIYYNRNLMEIYSDKETIIYDDKDNVFNLEDHFKFDIVKEIISSDKTNVIDNENNNYAFEKVKINLKTNEFAGKEVKVDFIDSFFGDERNDPILKGKTTISNDQETKIHKAVFTTCNTENKKCPGWELESNEFVHNKEKRTFEYYNAWLKVFGQKLAFTPYLSHPDPTVKRKSGFLTPTYSLPRNNPWWVHVPYFYAISEDKDMTFNPRIYADDRFIFQTEYRQAFQNSDLITDMSINADGNNTNSHFYYFQKGEFKKKDTLDSDYNSTNYTINIQNVSNDEYLKIHNLALTSPIINDESSLQNKISLSKKIDEETEINANFSIYEDLSKKGNDRFQYVFPDFNFSKNIPLDERYKGTFKFTADGFQKNYDTNKYEVLLNNSFLFESDDIISSTGILTDYDLLVKNFNSYSENSTNYKENNDNEVYGSFIVNSRYPLVKINESSSSYLKPIISARYSPNDNDISGDNTMINYDNTFNFNRIDNIEGGKSLSFGLEYEIRDLEDDSIFGLYLANSISDRKRENLPSKSKLDQTRSDIVGKLYYTPNDFLNVNYQFSYDRDLDGSNYDSINTEFDFGHLVTKFGYHSQSENLGDSEVASNETLLQFGENTFKFNTTKNLQTDFTEYYNLIYTYETDCLSASLQYNKKFYRDQDLVPDETLMFTVKFIPFVELKPETIPLNKYLRK